MKRMMVAAIAAVVMGIGALVGALGAGEASAACTTFDEHNKVVMRDCPSGSAGSATVPDGAAAHRGETPDLPDLPAKEEPEEPAEPTEPTEPTEPETPVED